MPFDIERIAVELAVVRANASKKQAQRDLATLTAMSVNYGEYGPTTRETAKHIAKLIRADLKKY